MSVNVKGGSPSMAMVVARVAVGLMFIMFAQYKLLHKDFAREGYSKYVTGYVQESSVSFYKPFLRATLKHPHISGYAVGVAELLIGLSMVLGVLRHGFFESYATGRMCQMYWQGRSLFVSYFGCGITSSMW